MTHDEDPAKARFPPIVRAAIRRLLPKKGRFFGPAMGRAFDRMTGFVAAIESDGFRTALDRLDPAIGLNTDSVKIVEALADRIVGGARGVAASIFCKSLLEAFFDACELDYDLEAFNPEAAMERFLATNNSEGFIELFLTRYIANAVWIAIQDDARDRFGEAALDDFRSTVDQISRQIAVSEVRRSSIDGSLMAIGPGSGRRLLEQVLGRLVS